MKLHEMRSLIPQRAEESRNVKFKVHFHEVSRSINLAAPEASGGADFFRPEGSPSESLQIREDL
jgi:hypothetical protein